MAGEREKKHAGSRPGRGRKEEQHPGMDTTEDFMASRVGVISGSGRSGEEAGEAQPEPGKDHGASFLTPATPGRTLPCIFLYFPASLAQGRALSR